MKRNWIDRAEYLIYRYVDDLFIQMRLLTSPDLETALNLPHHGLTREALVVLLYRLFQEHSLVAKDDNRHLFTPTLDELEAALDESEEHAALPSETFYGLTSGAMERYAELKSRYADTP